MVHPVCNEYAQMKKDMFCIFICIIVTRNRKRHNFLYIARYIKVFACLVKFAKVASLSLALP